ncbi:MAG: glycoside hydrolase [Herbinix sp.]|jgi:predicted GH43/DUF377 family glycosyl hydrolase|nr:glycoside hydrolase [Herbinix sp.]
MKAYKNPFLFENQWSENECGDPFIMRFNGMYYLYCSSSGEYIKCWSSEDLIDFKYEGSVCDDPIITGAYAPEVSYYKGRFYMITSPIGSGHYLLSAEAPTGPFAVISDNYGLLIDGSIFTDDNGARYMLHAGHNGIEIHTMSKDDCIDVNGEIIPEAYLGHWTEGPMIIKKDGYYYLTYTGNHLLSKGYRVAYSVSNTAPDRGYVNLKNRTFLIETGPEFHGLGHSSSFLAPDLDSYSIAYHSFDLDRTPHRRSTNIDRLFFNGARMYCNPIWWEQAAHRMPDYYGRGKEVLKEKQFRDFTALLIPEKTSEYYTAEVNVNSHGQEIQILYGVSDDCYGMIHIGTDRTYEIRENDKMIRSGTYNDAISLQGYLAVRIAKKPEHTMELYLNHMLLCSYETILGNGWLGLVWKEEQEIGFVAHSSCVAGNGDNLAHKAIPGRFDAVHCRESMEKYPCIDSGLTTYSGCLKANQKYSYDINVKETGSYQLFARVKSYKTQVCMKAEVDADITVCTGVLSGVFDEEEFEMISLGEVKLPSGIHVLALEAEDDEIAVDYFEFIQSGTMDTCDVIKEGHLVTEKLQILGHKRAKSMIHKYSGFTCAENHGMAFIGEAGMTDYKISSIIHRNHRNSGDVSIFVRATKESWFGAQVKEAFFGYRVRVTCDGVFLYRENYDETQLASYSFRGLNATFLALDVVAKRSKLLILVNNRPVIDYTDPQAFLYGKIGMEATGEGFGFEHFSISL